MRIVNAIKKFFLNIWDALKPYKKNIIIPLLKIIGVIIICVILIRVMTGDETLAEYAAKNPDTAYSTEIPND